MLNCQLCGADPGPDLMVVFFVVPPLCLPASYVELTLDLVVVVVILLQAELTLLIHLVQRTVITCC